MGFYDELDRQAAADPLNAALDDAIEMFIERFGKAPHIPTEIGFTREKLINALNEAAASGDPGPFSA